MCVKRCDAGHRLQPGSGTGIPYSPVRDRTPSPSCVPGSGLIQSCAHFWRPKRQILMNQMLPSLHLQVSIQGGVRGVADACSGNQAVTLCRCTGHDPQTCPALVSEAEMTLQLVCAWQLLSSKTIVLYPITS